jgi:hypothetical protein
MKNYFLFVFCIVYFQFNGFTQTWHTINKVESYMQTPYRQFSINPYTNDIWLIHDTRVALIKNNGQLQLFEENELGTLWSGCELNFAFTNNLTYFKKNLEGLYTFENSVRTLKFTDGNIGEIRTNSDTVYIDRDGESILKYTPLSTLDTYFNISKIIVKGAFLYTDNGAIGMKNGVSNVLLWNDPQYLMGTIQDKKFSRYSDSLFVGLDKGISKAYNYDFFDTITPNNSTNMPSPNVLEIEFDHNDSLWAVFGDINDVPFAIAKLEGYTWTNLIDANNSPIDFTAFYGLEIDTLGNLWVADDDALHTLLTPNSPSWLNTPEISDINQLKVFPNPFNDVLTIRSVSKSIKTIEMTDVNGRIIYQKSLNSISFDIQTAHWKEGIYFLKCQFDDGTEHLMKVTK